MTDENKINPPVDETKDKESSPENSENAKKERGESEEGAQDSDTENTAEEGPLEETEDKQTNTEKTVDEIVGEVNESDGESDFSKTPEQEFQERTKELVLPTLMKFFRPELLNRFDDLIFFHPLRKKDLELIVDIMLREPREMLREKNIEFRLSDAAKSFLSEKGYNPAFGARPLRRTIQKYVEDPFSDALLGDEFVSGDTVFIDINEAKDGLSFQKDIADEKNQSDLDPYAEIDEQEDQEHVKKQENENISEENQEADEALEEGENDIEEKKDAADGDMEQNPVDEKEESDNSGKKKTFFSKMFNKNKQEE